MKMECTQRLECTQELYSTQSENFSSEQIGFLGICGKKYPVKKGPNKIGRDPQTCSIVLNLNSVSRLHAVINVLNKKDFLLMDLDSANKTKLMGQTLQPYIPKPLRNGDTVQFGEIFGVFRLLEEEDDLPMTQALDIPDTPVPAKHMSRINAITTVPESPDVSDKDDSFIVPSQPKGPAYQSPKTRNFIKPGRTISIQPIGTNKIDNIYWNSSKKSTSLNLDDSNASLNDSIPGVSLNNKENKISNNIHELETQMPPEQKELNDSKGSIYTANTQLPESGVGPSIHTINTQLPSGDIYSANTQMPELCDVASIHTANTQLPNATSSPSIHTVNTQMPCGTSPSIHTMNTQLPPGFGSPSIHTADTQIPCDNLSEVCKINQQDELQFDLCASKHDDSIFNAETQIYNEKEKVPMKSRSTSISPSSAKSNNLNSSNDEVLFDDVHEPYEEVPESQAILTEDIDLPINRIVESVPEFEILSQMVVPKSAKRNMRIGSDSSADCEDIEILPTQKLTENNVGDDDTTDCEDNDNMIELKIDKTALSKDIDIVDGIEDLPTQVIGPSRVNKDVDFEDMPTQVLDEVDIIEKDTITKKANPVVVESARVDFEDLPTQVLDEDLPLKNQSIHTKSIITDEENSPFKIPCNSVLKAKRVSKTPKIKPIKYYQDTQDIYEDLCTQKSDSIEGIENEKPCNKLILDTSVISVDSEETPDDFAKNLTNQEILEMIGVDKQVVPVTKVPSDGSTASDVENTPKKLRHFNFNTVLPDSQEIKTSVSLNSRTIHTESSSDSETEQNSEEQFTPIVYKKKMKTKPDVKLDLSKKFDFEALPSRIITRVRKPTEKLQDAQNKKVVENILKPKFFTEQDEIDANTIDVIKCNISKLKSEKTKKSNQSSIDVKQIDCIDIGIAESVKRVRTCRKKPEEMLVVKSDAKSEKSKESKEDTKSKERKKREPRNTKNQLQDSKNQSSVSNISSNQSLPIMETKEKISITNKSKETESLDSTKKLVETKRTRTTRNAKTSKAEEKSSTPVGENQTEKPKRKYTRKMTRTETKKEETVKGINTETIEKDTVKSPEQEIRRSKRKRTVKEEVKKESNPKSILKNASILRHEESVVYNMSSSSNSDSSRSFKRPTLDDNEAPSPKRTRSAAYSSRMTPSRTVQTQYVLFTAFPFEQVKVKLENMGAIVVTDLMKSTVVLTKQIKRTFKLLCAVGLGKPIVGPTWVQACADNNIIVDPWLYLIKDEVAEKRFHFSLERTLKGKRNFLKGYNVSSTPKVMPEAHEMKLIVECSGGTWKEGGPQWICVSVPGDSTLWPALQQRGATIVSTEFILGGVLRQRVDIEANTFKRG